MEPEPVLETGDVVIPRLVGIGVGGVDADSEVGTDDQVADVVTQPESGAQRDFIEQPFPFQFRTGAFGRS